VGKSTLVDALADALVGYRIVDEPYRLLEHEGHEMADPPSADDYELQLQRSLAELAENTRADVIFDRCPVDFVAYLQAIDAEPDLDDLAASMRDVIASLDLIVFVSIEDPDRIEVSPYEDLVLRDDVDHRLRALLDGPFGFGVRVLEVSGSVDARCAQIIRALRDRD
jgi:hypothetical protein